MPPRKHPLSKHKTKFGQQRRDAAKRGIPFNFTFEEWFELWTASGQLHNRGRLKGQYVMARFNDVGSYTLKNVKIILCEENHKEAAPRMCGIPKSEEAKRNLSRACLGRRLSESAKIKIGLAHKGRAKGPMSEETKRKLSIAHTGKPGRQLSKQNKEKLLAGQRKYWVNRRAGNI